MRAFLQVLAGQVLAGLLLCGSALAAAAQAEAGEKAFNITPQSMPEALNQFAHQSGYQLLFQSRVARALTAPRIVGSFTPEDALKQLLANTGLSYRFINATTITISAGQDKKSGSEASGQTAVDAADEVMHLARTGAGPADARAETPAPGAAPQQTDVVVTGTRIRGAEDIAAPTFVIDRKDLEQTGYSTLKGVFEDLPQNFSEISSDGVLGEGGSRLRSANTERATGIDLRGLGAQSTLTLLNGQRRAGTVGGRVVDISVIPLSVIERVEVVTGGRSAVYGSDAVAGVVNLVTRHDFQGTETQASFGWNRYGGEALQASQIAGRELRRGGFVVAYDYEREWPLDLVDTAMLVTPTLEGTENTRLDAQGNSRRHSLFAAGRFSLTDRIELHADGLYADKRFDFINEFFYLQDGAGDSFSNVEQSGDQYSASVGARMSLPRAWTLDLGGATGAARGRSLQLAFLDFGCYPDEGCLSQAYDLSNDSRSRTSSGSAIFDGPLFAIGSLRPRAALGLESREEMFRSFAVNPGAQDDDKRRTIDSAFAELLLPWAAGGARAGVRRVEVSLAGRFDDYSDFGGSFNPQAGVVLTMAGGLTLRGAYSEAFRAPALVELGTQTAMSLNNRVDPAVPSRSSPVLLLRGDNPDLGPERARTWSVGLEFEPAFAPRARLSLSYFNIAYEDRIEVPAFNTADQILVLQRESRFLDLIVRNPTQAQVDAFRALNNGSTFNFTGRPWNQQTTPILTAFPTLVLFDNRVNNIAVETVSGLDLQLKTAVDSPIGTLSAGLNATYTLDHERSVTAASPPYEILNEVGRPVDFRIRANVGWTRGAYGAYLHLNHVTGYDNPFTAPVSRMGSWTTADLTLRFNGSPAQGRGWLQGLSASVSVSNLLAAAPPSFNSSLLGLKYDAANANPFGRHMAVSVVKNW